MKEKQQDSLFTDQVISPLAKEKTYGEKMYDRIFNNLINFWLNLFMAAAFTQWVAHGTGKIRLWGMKSPDTPRGVQQFISDKLEKSVIPFFKPVLPKNKTLAQNAYAATEILTLQLPGHVAIIPSVWLGAKIKPAFVRWWNRRHYGEEGSKDASIAYREAMIDAAPKPTLIGAILARFASTSLAFGMGAIMGSDNNYITDTGRKYNFPLAAKFPGINDMAFRAGAGLGSGVMDAMPGLEGVNGSMQKHLTWSQKQRAAGMHLAADGKTEKVYNRAIQDFFGFTAMDVAYTWVLAAGVHPFMRLVGKIPGMTYRTHPPVDQSPVTSKSGDTTKLKSARNPLGDKVESPGAGDAEQAPAKINLGEIKHLDRLQPVSKQELQQ